MKPRSRSRIAVGFSPFVQWNAATSSFLFLLASCILLLFSVLRPTALSGIRTTSADLFAPALGLASLPFQSLADAVSGVTGLTELRAENARLEQENTRLHEWYQAALRLQAENQSLRELLHVKTDPTYSFITARVIADAGNAYVKSMLVSAGSEDGVREGQAVISGDGLVGRIVETGSNTARVVLLTDLNARVPVLIEGSRQRAILAGTNADLPVLMYLPPDSSAPEGARIVTSGDGGIFPPGLPVGNIVAGPDGKRHVSLFADTGRLVHVRIVNIPDDPNLVRNPSDFHESD